MRALRLAEFGRLEVVELPDPTPGPGEVLIGVGFTGICGTDLHGYTGANGRRRPGQVMGHETSGRVRAVGPGVAGPAPGTAVTVNPVVVPEADADAWRGREQQHPDKYVIGVRPDLPAAFAQSLVVPARNVVTLPAGMPLTHGALIEPLAVATHAVARLPRVAGATVLMTGGGPIGQSVVVALRQAGAATVVVSEPSAPRRNLLAGLGAVVIDPADGPVAEQVLALTGAASCALDAVGTSGSVADCLQATEAGATVCLVGMASPRLELAAFDVTTAERMLTGSFAYSSLDFATASEALAGTPQLADALISRTVPLAEAPATFAALAAGDPTPGKVLVSFER
ncbi:zinc-dependent alcohol dehydrogenase [Micropruina sonneratiae]|uniref:zinc-dependent alcohol dehydrogenase n=1 Tax=Micropruina sonneratiae TaxID=2986940 RepID=UPI002226E0C0|nr:alcohol dehydrogenase catalytic domain-containing protein [Micropruina sp. KQZ13P-5]MCW3158047.1 alcohol dehydrogenase catalytic domain-containing protein [Micropruina sp. KQZ13P-5]